MPVINFAKAKGAYLGTKKGNKAYIGDELVWEEEEKYDFETELTYSWVPSEIRIYIERLGDWSGLRNGKYVEIKIGKYKLKTYTEIEGGALYIVGKGGDYGVSPAEFFDRGTKVMLRSIE